MHTLRRPHPTDAIVTSTDALVHHETCSRCGPRTTVSDIGGEPLARDIRRYVGRLARRPHLFAMPGCACHDRRTTRITVRHRALDHEVHLTLAYEHADPTITAYRTFDDGSVQEFSDRAVSQFVGLPARPPYRPRADHIGHTIRCVRFDTQTSHLELRAVVGTRTNRDELMALARRLESGELEPGVRLRSVRLHAGDRATAAQLADWLRGTSVSVGYTGLCGIFVQLNP